MRIDAVFLQILSNKNDIINLLRPFNNLKVLELHTGFEKNNVPGLAFLFRSSPTLHTLILKIINDFKIERRVSTITVLFYLPYIHMHAHLAVVLFHIFVLSAMEQRLVGLVHLCRRAILGIPTPNFKVFPRPPQGSKDTWILRV